MAGWRGESAHHGSHSHLGVAMGRAKDPREQLESEKRGVGRGPVVDDGPVERVGERGYPHPGR